MTSYETQEWESLEMEGGEWEAQEWETSEWESQEWEAQEWETPEWESEGYEAETELVSELLEVTSEQELEQFLGRLFRRTARTVGGVIKSPVGRALSSNLKNVARQALPAVGGALGSLVLPGVGGAIGSQIGSKASQMFEMELEGMNEQEAEFETGKRFVRLATTAARQAARAPRSAPARAVARAALITAAKRHAPGLLRGTPAGRRGRPQQRRQPGQRRPKRRPGRAASGPWADGGTSGGGPSGGGPSGGCPPCNCPRCDGEPPSFQDSDDGDVADSDSSELGGPNPQGRPQTGRWIRRGRKIVIMGA